MVWMVTRSVEIRYDPEANAAYIYVVPRGTNRSVARTKFCDVEFDGASINVDLDSENRIVGFEILGANKVLPEELLAESQIETG